MRTYSKINILLLCCFIFVVAVIGFTAYVSTQTINYNYDYQNIKKKGYITALTLKGSNSYFVYKNEKMGYEYELCKDLADYLKVDLKIKTAHNINNLITMLNEGEGDFIAYNIPYTRTNNNRYIRCGKKELTHQVLIQRKSNKMVNSILDLIGKNVYVRENTKYHKRLKDLNEEIGGKINIKFILDQSITSEDMIEQVALGKYDFTIVESSLAELNKTFYKNIDDHVNISFPQAGSWITLSTMPITAKVIEKWSNSYKYKKNFTSLTKKYFEKSKGTPSPFFTHGLLVKNDSTISKYDKYFKEFADSINWDWKLLASIAYQESKFNPKAESWIGAQGIMQVMPRTAQAFNINPDSLYKTKFNLKASIRLIKSLQKSFKISDKVQKQKIILACYNAGIGHILDARALARKYNKNPNVWDQNLDYFILNKSKPDFYDDPVCKAGYLRGYETASFVTEIWTRYQYYIRRLKN